MLISKISSSKKWQQRRWCLWISSSGEFIIFSILYSPPPASPNDRIGIIACSDRGQWFYWRSSSSSRWFYWSSSISLWFYWSTSSRQWFYWRSTVEVATLTIQCNSTERRSIWSHKTLSEQYSANEIQCDCNLISTMQYKRNYELRSIECISRKYDCFVLLYFISQILESGAPFGP